jgi:hypothetical protein
MSAAILDRARAFEMIAAHLPEQKRAEIAAALGDKLLAEIGGAKPKPPAVSAPRPEPVPTLDLSEHTEVASFLVDHGYQGAALVQATGRLTTFLTKHKELTRTAGMHVWLRDEKGLAK